MERRSRGDQQTQWFEKDPVCRRDFEAIQAELADGLARRSHVSRELTARSTSLKDHWITNISPSLNLW